MKKLEDIMKAKTLLFTALTLLLGLQVINAQISIYGMPVEIAQAPLDPIEYSDWDIVTHTGIENDFIALHFSDDYHGWIIAEDGMMIYTKDGGLNWEEKYFGSSMHLQDVYFTDNETGFIVGSIDVGPHTKGILYQTNDGGETWNLKYMSKPQAIINHVSFSTTQKGFATGNTIAPAGSDGLALVTNDGGETWEDFTIQTPGFTFTNIHFPAENEGWAVGKLEVGPSEVSVVLKSDDGGRVWNTSYYTTSNVNLKDISFNDSNNGFVVGDQGSILITKDAGSNWTAQNFRQYKFNATLAGNDNNGWVVGDDGAIISTFNNGVHWVHEITLLETNLNAICSTPNGFVWVVGDAGTLYMHKPNSIDPPRDDQDVNNGTDKAATIPGTTHNGERSNEPLVNHKNFPNPFAGKTTISFELDQDVNVRLDVYNISGQLITTLKDQHLEVGTHEVVFDATDLAPGIYTYILSAGNYFDNGKMIMR